VKLENMQSSTGSLCGLVIRERMPAGSAATELSADFADYTEVN
jgi:hypothetical protein